MSNEKPKDLKIGCSWLHCHDTDTASFDGHQFTKEDAKQAKEWLQQFIDYEKPAWLPRAGELYRHRDKTTIYVRLPGECADYRGSTGTKHQFPCLLLSNGTLKCTFKDSKDLVPA